MSTVYISIKYSMFYILIIFMGYAPTKAMLFSYMTCFTFSLIFMRYFLTKGQGHAIFLHDMIIVKTKGYSTDLLDPTQVESKKCSQIQWPVPSINAEPVDIFLGEE